MVGTMYSKMIKVDLKKYHCQLKGIWYSQNILK